MVRLSAYVKRKTTIKKKSTKQKSVKKPIKKQRPVSKAEIVKEQKRSGYSGKITPYIRKQLEKKALEHR